MFSRGGFLYKRSQNDAHRNLVARVSPTLPSVAAVSAPSTSPSASSDAKTTDNVNPLTSAVVPVPQTSVTPATSPSPSTLSSSTPTVSSPSAASSPSPLSSSTSKASTASSASLALTASSAVSTPLTLASTPTTHAPSVATQIVTGTLSIPKSSLAPSSTSSAGSSSTTNTGAIVGGVAGTIAGIAVLGFLLMWCMRRQRNRDIDNFDAQAFKRQSAVLLDDPVEPSPSYNPRPPTMIEHHNTSPALAAQSGYTGQNFYGSYDGYGQQPHAPSEMIQSVGSPPPQAYGASPMGYTSYNDSQRQVAMQNVGYAGYDSQHQLVRQPSNAAYLTRLPSSAAGYVPPAAPSGSIDPNAHYTDLSRSSISPYQAAQYADISRQLGTNNPSGQAHRESSELLDAPLPSPFDDPVEATPVSDVTSHAQLDRSSDAPAPGPVSATPARQTQGNAHQRPTTIYEEGDAYGGI
ncbi:hypothetical protein J3R82DRAFT_2645 [Butyriboletus roseoflavus]|nr:hypothetical protein J3R82DRAFT_2645 [Butyriboletus roseoflavus]